MKRFSQTIILITMLILTGSTSCQPVFVFKSEGTTQLASSIENYVDVTITLEQKNNGQYFLSATFTPLDSSLHLYSKNIPRKGLEGLGRPTLLELAQGSSIKSIGELIESSPPQLPLSGPQGLQTYPAGAITLSLPIQLPQGKGWHNEQVIVTYMACNNEGCRPPVEGKIIAIQIPGNGNP